MSNRTSYPGLLKKLLKCSEKVERYRHHVVINSTYLELNAIPKGFRLKSHSNIEDCDPSSLLRKCSKKLMVKTIGSFKTKLNSSLEVLTSTHNELLQQFPEKDTEITSKLKSRVNKQREILSIRRNKKFERDGIDLQKSSDVSQRLIQQLIQGQRRPNIVELKRDEVLSDVVIPPYEPLNLDAKGRELPPGLSELCKTFDWLQLQKDFDKFRNSMRAKVFFSRTEPEQAAPNSRPQAPKPSSKWRAPKSSIPEVETFLNKVESELFSYTKRKRVDDNLTQEERGALNAWRKASTSLTIVSR